MRNCAQHVTPAWIGGGITVRATKPGRTLPLALARSPAAGDAGGRVGGHGAGRTPVLRLTNPNLPGIASNTLVANIQIVMPGEIARAHRHSGAALR